MRLLFFALTKKQYRYFKNLSKNLTFESRVLFFPNLNLSYRGLNLLNRVKIEPIMDIKLREIEIKYSNRIHKFLYRKLLQFQIPWIIMSIYRALKRYKPNYLVVWNGKKFHQAIALEVAKILNVKSIFFENGVLPNRTTMDFKGVNASNSLPRKVEFYRNLKYGNRKLPTNLETRVSKYSRIKFTSTLPSRYIFVPFQVAYDTQIVQHSPWIDSMFKLFNIIEWLSKKVDIIFIIKEHPSDRVSDYTSLYRRAEGNIRFSSENTQTLIENSTAIITINSSVAIEALLFKKRVIVLGEAFFRIKGIVKMASSKEEILEILNSLESWNLDKDLIDNFIYYIYYEYLIPTNWRHPDNKHYKSIEQRIKSVGI